MFEVRNEDSQVSFETVSAILVPFLVHFVFGLSDYSNLETHSTYPLY